MLDTNKLIEDINAQGKPALQIEGAEDIVRHLAPQLRAGDVVAIMSNGGFGGIHEKLLQSLGEKQESGDGSQNPEG